MGKLTFNLLLTTLAALALAGCASPQRSEPSFAPIAPPSVQYAPTKNGAIYQTGSAMLLFQDMSARRIGDILTVNLEERTQAEKKADTNLDKQQDISMVPTKIFGQAATINGVPLLDNQMSSANGSKGKADSSQSNKLQGSITVSVAEVLGNGNLVVQGEKWITINQGDEYVRLRGIVRTVDINADNTISSTKVANAQIYYAGKGVMDETNQPGWLTRFFLGPWSPF